MKHVDLLDPTPTFNALLDEFAADGKDVLDALTRDPWNYRDARARIEPSVQEALRAAEPLMESTVLMSSSGTLVSSSIKPAPAKKMPAKKSAAKKTTTKRKT